MKIAIIDDCAKDCEIIEEYMLAYLSEYLMDSPVFIQSFQNGEEFLDSFSPDFYDMIFLDHYMSPLSGLETARAIRETDSAAVIIFTTASRDFAVESYMVKASGYLVKPIAFEDFSKLLSLLDIQKLKGRQFIEIVCGYDTVRIPLNTILYGDICGHYIQLHTSSMGICKARMSFARLCAVLAPYPEFLVCYRGCIVNMNHIHHMAELTFFMDNGERLLLNRKNHGEVLKKYYNFLFQKIRNDKP